MMKMKVAVGGGQSWILKSETLMHSKLDVCSGGTAIILRSATALLFAVGLSLPRREKTCREKKVSVWLQMQVMRI